MKALARILLGVGITIVIFPSTPVNLNNSDSSVKAQAVQQSPLEQGQHAAEEQSIAEASLTEPQTAVKTAQQQTKTVGLPEKPLTDKQKLMSQAGIPQKDWNHADYIITHESTWRSQVWGRQTKLGKAYGLCQSLPASKMASVGGDYMTNPVTQLKWCHQYAHSRYGSWQGAYNFWVVNKWW